MNKPKAKAARFGESEPAASGAVQAATAKKTRARYKVKSYRAGRTPPQGKAKSTGGIAHVQPLD
jgi:hypothetical protein